MKVKQGSRETPLENPEYYEGIQSFQLTYLSSFAFDFKEKVMLQKKAKLNLSWIELVYHLTKDQFLNKY